MARFGLIYIVSKNPRTKESKNRWKSIYRKKETNYKWQQKLHSWFDSIPTLQRLLTTITHNPIETPLIAS